jgi:hypothetical protein
MKITTTTYEQAKRAEESGSFFNAAAFYKETLELAIKANDSKLIKHCKRKVVEMNKKSIDSGKDFKEVEVSVDMSDEDQKGIKENIEKIIGPENINTILEAVGCIPWFCPDIQEIERQAVNSTPIFYQFANLQTVNDSGHSLRGGSDPKYSWFMDSYNRTQKFIMEIYLNRIFYMLIKHKKLTNNELSEYFSHSGLFEPNQLKIVNVGLEKYFEEDYVSALHILVPQFEFFLLHCARRLGISTVVLDTKLDVATRTLTLSENHLDSEEFKNIFGENFCRQVKFVLFEPLGYKIRHKVAHGEISFDECNFQNATLILFLYLFLLGRIGVKEAEKSKPAK